MTIIRIISLAALALVAQSASAQDPDTITLNTVVISATKTPSPRSELTQSVTVINGDDLRARGVARVSDALQQVPGVILAQNGSFGSVTSLFLRGGESRYTKILIDGVAVNQAGGYFDFSHLTTDNVERIEIVRGPASVLYGADAVTGVIQIFTRQGRGPLSVGASGRGGTYGTIDGDLGLSGSRGAVAYSLAGAAHKTDGLYNFNNQYSNGTLSGSLALSPRPTTTARLNARYTNAEFHYPTDFTGAPVDTNSYRVQHRLTVGLDAAAELSPSAGVRFLAGTNEVSDLTEDIAVPFDATDRQHSADKSRAHRRTAEARLALGGSGETGRLNIGAEYVWEGERNTGARGPVGASTSPTLQFDANRQTRGVYAELLGSPKRFVGYTAAIRLDDNSDYGTHTTYRLGTSYPVLDDTRIKASLSTAYNAPAFNQIRATLFTVANTDLSPERSRSWEVGVERLLTEAHARISASYFSQRFDDLIQFVSGGPPTFVGRYENLAQATSKGYEAELEVTPSKGTSASASFTVASPRVTAVSQDGDGSLVVGTALLRRPTHSGSASMTTASGGRSLSLTASYVGKRPDIDFNLFPSPTVTLPAYTRVDASSESAIWRGQRGSSLSLTARIENVLDKRYETVLHYPAPGRTFLVGARFSGSL
jgi:vitamin B12 transporter